MPDLILSLVLLVGLIVALAGIDAVPFTTTQHDPLSENQLRSLYGR
ncbi:MAG: hypothetical protein L0221_07525 [Chloroflexi bacterium]|nr:hypothetical protein [Chloroflexota bacterium]